MARENEVGLRLASNTAQLLRAHPRSFAVTGHQADLYGMPPEVDGHICTSRSSTRRIMRPATHHGDACSSIARAGRPADGIACAALR